MKKIEVLNINGEAASKIELNENIWGITPNDAVLYDALRLARNNQRQGTADTKTRSEVSGGGKKPWRQKGTGRARQGSTKGPQFIGGGVVFAPKPRDFSKKVNKQSKRLALLSALSQKLAQKEITVLDKFEVPSAKTKDAQNFLNAFKFDGTVLVVGSNNTDAELKATNNIPNLNTVSVELLNTYDVVSNKNVVLTQDAIKFLEEANA